MSKENLSYQEMHTVMNRTKIKHQDVLAVLKMKVKQSRERMLAGGTKECEVDIAVSAHDGVAIANIKSSVKREFPKFRINTMRLANSRMKIMVNWT